MGSVCLPASNADRELIEQLEDLRKKDEDSNFNKLLPDRHTLALPELRTEPKKIKSCKTHWHVLLVCKLTIHKL